MISCMYIFYIYMLSGVRVDSSKSMQGFTGFAGSACEGYLFSRRGASSAKLALLVSLSVVRSVSFYLPV